MEMNFIKRAFLSVKTRKGKSLLQIFVFTVICVLVLSGISIQSAAEKSSELARQKLGAEVTLQVDIEKMRAQAQSEGGRVRFERTPIAIENAEELVSYPQLKAYNFYSSTNGIAENFEPIESEESAEETTDSEQSSQGDRMPMGNGNRMFDADVTVEGVVFTDSVQEFLDGESTIIDGRHLTEEDLNKTVTVIEKSLAEQNELVIGDVITVSSVNDEALVQELEIVGIYETTSTGTDQGMNFSFMNPYNKLYVPFTAASSLKGADYENTIDSAIYYMNDPAEIDSFVEEAKQKSSIDFETFTLNANDQLYQQMVGPIQNVASFSNNVVYLVTIAGAIILGLIVMLSIRERKYEMGVLLAIGENRWKLIGQFVVEIVLVAVLALGISTISGNMVANKIGEQLLSQEIQQTEVTTTPESFRGGRGFGMLNQANQQVNPVDEITVEVTAKDLGMLSMIGLLIAVLAALLPSLTVLRLQPKTILTRQD